MTKTLSTRFGLMVLIAAVFALAGASFVFAHTQDYGGGDDQIEGHDHADQLWGGAGCDTMNLHGSSDLGYGGDNGCDDVRGMGGADDVVSVWEDNYGNDFVGGGDGNSDHCYAGAQDGWDFWTCEALN